MKSNDSKTCSTCEDRKKTKRVDENTERVIYESVCGITGKKIVNLRTRRLDCRKG